MHVAPEQYQQGRILRWRDVCDRVGLSRATIWRKVRLGAFPKPVQLGPQSVGWLEREISAWIEARAAQRSNPETA